MHAPQTGFQKFIQYLTLSSISLLAVIILFLAIPLELLPFFSAYIPDTHEEKISRIVSQTGGTSITVTLDSIVDEQGGYRANCTYTCNGLRAVMVSGAMNIMKTVFTDTSLAAIHYCTLCPHTTVIDYYGRKSVLLAAKMELGRGVARQVVWENLTVELYGRLLQNEGEWWMHGEVR